MGPACQAGFLGLLRRLGTCTDNPQRIALKVRFVAKILSGRKDLPKKHIGDYAFVSPQT